MQLSPFRNMSLENCIKVGDSGRYKINLDNDKDAIFEEVLNRIESGSIEFSHTTVAISHGRKLHLLKDYHSVLALRATAKAFNRKYNVKFQSRNNIIKGVLETASDATPSYIVRCDIESFFENVDASNILRELERSPNLHPHLKTILNQLESDGLITSSEKGLPRGLGLSTTFAELRLKKFDHQVQFINGVYRYFRFADDILLFTTQNPKDLIDKIKLLLKPDLSLNSNKSGEPIPLRYISQNKASASNKTPSKF